MRSDIIEELGSGLGGGMSWSILCGQDRLPLAGPWGLVITLGNAVSNLGPWNRGRRMRVSDVPDIPNKYQSPVDVLMSQAS